MYAMLGTHPDIAFSITKLSQYSANPGDITGLRSIVFYSILVLLGTSSSLMMETPSAMMSPGIQTQIGLETLETIAPFPDTSLLWLEQP